LRKSPLTLCCDFINKLLRTPRLAKRPPIEFVTPFYAFAFGQLHWVSVFMAVGSTHEPLSTRFQQVDLLTTSKIQSYQPLIACCKANITGKKYSENYKNISQAYIESFIFILYGNI